TGRGSPGLMSAPAQARCAFAELGPPDFGNLKVDKLGGTGIGGSVMLEIGDRVRHRKFGTGTLRQINPRPGHATGPTALVEWDSHRVSQPWSGYSEAYSWVYLRSLAHDRPAPARARG